jgi:biopolymer transport protein ExbD
MEFRSDNDRLEPLSAFSHSSLTDIVLLLLIFFLLTSSFVVNNGIEVAIPKAESSVESQARNISVTVTKRGEYYVDEKRVSSSQLAEAIRLSQAKSSQTTLVLRADKDATVDNAVRVMNIAKALNLKIVIATEPGFNP